MDVKRVIGRMVVVALVFVVLVVVVDPVAAGAAQIISDSLE